jgi:hypothetical protein
VRGREGRDRRTFRENILMGGWKGAAASQRGGWQYAMTLYARWVYVCIYR